MTTGQPIFIRKSCMTNLSGIATSLFAIQKTTASKVIQTMQTEPDCKEDAERIFKPGNSKMEVTNELYEGSHQLQK